MSPTRDEVLSYVREELAVGGASRDSLLREAFNNRAPHSVILALFHLPARHFFNAEDLRQRLPEDDA